MVGILAKVEGSDCTRRDFQEITKQFFARLYGVEDPRREGYPKV